MLTLLTCLLLAVPDAAVEVQSVAGDVKRGALVELSEGQIVIASEKVRVTVPAADLEQVRFSGSSPAPTAPSVWIELIDGSQLLASDFTMKGGSCRVVLLDASPPITLPASALRTVRLKEQSAPLAAEWGRIVAREVSSDLAVVRKNDHLDFVEGVLQEVEGRAAAFRMDDEVVRIARNKLDGLVIYHAKSDRPPAAVAVVACSDGTRLQAAKMAVVGDKLNVTTAAGVRLAIPLATLTQVDFAAAKAVFLSDLEPQLAQWEPYFPAGNLAEPLGNLFHPRRNQALLYGETAGDDGALKLRFPGENGVPVVRSYAKGLALHSKSRLVYELPEDFRRLKATAGIDARLGRKGNVQLLIEGDGRQLLATSVSGSDVPRLIDVDLHGIKKLVIIVDFGEQLDLGDYLNLCDARLVR